MNNEALFLIKERFFYLVKSFTFASKTEENVIKESLFTSCYNFNYRPMV
ncbi:Uncharacterised protein [Myroides odoratus]|nr:hypothetical protein HMPREF9716_01707 [Myroides odoratus CIP 103059]STZ29945.1 Uncharacterised protein [Myroides odoratus]